MGFAYLTLNFDPGKPPGGIILESAVGRSNLIQRIDTTKNIQTCVFTQIKGVMSSVARGKSATSKRSTIKSVVFSQV
jgi:hypothetical protein